MAFRRTDSGLWVPNQDGDPGRTYVPRSDTLLIRAGYEQIFGVQVDWDDLVARLQVYTLSQLCVLLGRTSAYLRHFGHRRRTEGQMYLCRQFFGDEHGEEIARRLEDLQQAERDEGRASRVSLFDELQVINTAKAGFLELPICDELEDTTELSAFGEALLIVSDLIEGEPADVIGVDPESEEGARRWLRYFVANSLFHHGTNLAHALPRAFDLFLTDRDHLSDHPAYIDLPRRAEELTGLTPREIWMALFALLGKWNVTSDDADVLPAVLVKDRYFENFAFPRERVDRFYGLAVAEGECLRELVQENYTREDLRPYHNLPFARYPLVELGNHLYCVSTKLLTERISLGSYHLFLDPDATTRRERGRFLTYSGTVFEEYVTEILERAFPVAAGRLIQEDELSEHLPAQSCDAAIVYEECLVLIEAKASIFSLEARAGEDWPALERQFHDLFTDAGSQLNGSIEAIEDGALAPLGLAPDRMRRYFPVVVTLEGVAMTAPIYDAISRNLERRGLLQQSKAAPLQVLDIDEVEFLEIGLSREHRLDRLLSEKIEEPYDRSDSFGNWGLRLGLDFLGQGNINQHLSEVFRGLTEEAVDYLREHEPDD